MNVFNLSSVKGLFKDQKSFDQFRGVMISTLSEKDVCIVMDGSNVVCATASAKITSAALTNAVKGKVEKLASHEFDNKPEEGLPPRDHTPHM